MGDELATKFLEYAHVAAHVRRLRRRTHEQHAVERRDQDATIEHVQVKHGLEERIAATLRKLESFGTRFVLSPQDDPAHGIGAAPFELVRVQTRCLAF